MHKLYKHLADGLHYFEGWDRDGVAVIHTGRVGDRGVTKELQSENGESVETLLTRELSVAQHSGFMHIEQDAISTLLVQYRVDDWEPEEALDFRHLVEDVLSNSLGWVGVGHCDGGDIGQNRVNVWCKVVDPLVGQQAILDGLNSRGLLEDVVLAIQSGNCYRPVYPPEYSGHFRP